MLKKLLQFWSNEGSLVDDMNEDFGRMISLGRDMFSSVSAALFDGEEVEQLAKRVYQADGKINTLEQQLRRRILTELAHTESRDVPACMVFMSISKDAERVGDYMKNLFEIFESRGKLVAEGEYYAAVAAMRHEVSGYFNAVLQVYNTDNEDSARELVGVMSVTLKNCDKYVSELLSAPGNTHNVSYVLLFRYFKRIVAHLSNVVSSVYMPVTMLDFSEPQDMG